MTALSCKVGERLRVGDQIAITVLAVRGQQVHLKISSPESTVIWREETYHQKDTNASTERMIDLCVWLGHTGIGETGKAS